MNGIRKSVLFREVNDRIAELLERAWPSAPGEFLCECGREDCKSRVELSIQEYRAVTVRGGTVLAPDCIRTPARPASVPSWLAA